MTASKSAPRPMRGAHANYRLLPESSIEASVDIRQRFASRDLGAAMNAWRHLYVRGLASPLVCRTLLSRWGLCACGRCLVDGGDR